MSRWAPDADAKVEQFLVEWLSDDAVRQHWTHQVSLLLSGQWSQSTQPASPIPRSHLPPTHPRPSSQGHSPHSNNNNSNHHHHTHGRRSPGTLRSPHGEGESSPTSSSSSLSLPSASSQNKSETHQQHQQQLQQRSQHRAAEALHKDEPSVNGHRKSSEERAGELGAINGLSHAAGGASKEDDHRARMRERRRRLKREAAVEVASDSRGEREPHPHQEAARGGRGAASKGDREQGEHARHSAQGPSGIHGRQEDLDEREDHWPGVERAQAAQAVADGHQDEGQQQKQQQQQQQQQRRRERDQPPRAFAGAQETKDLGSAEGAQTTPPPDEHQHIDATVSATPGELEADGARNRGSRADVTQGDERVATREQRRGSGVFVFPELRTTGGLMTLEEDMVDEVESAFCQGGEVTLDDFQLICRVCGLPTVLAADMMYACAVTQRLDVVNTEPVSEPTPAASISEDNPIHQLPDSVPSGAFAAFWNALRTKYRSPYAKAMHILNPVGRALEPHHLRRLVYYAIETHPGLDFLVHSPEYHPRYVDTVVARIFYTVNRSWSRRINLRELQRSPLLSVLTFLDEEPNINKETQFFSYEHFYVIYTSFWKLDRDRDLAITQQELAEYGDGGLSALALERIFSHTVFAHPSSSTTHMAYWDFVFYILSEEDKTTPTAIEYWFRVMDLDGDGVLSFYELEQFYDEQLHRLDEIGVEGMPFVDVLCMNIDMVSPKNNTMIRLLDLKKSGMASRFLNTFLNVQKYLDQEEGEDADMEAEGGNAWHRFATREYILLSSEEDDQSGDDADEDSTLHSPLIKY